MSDLTITKSRKKDAAYYIKSIIGLVTTLLWNLEKDSKSPSLHLPSTVSLLQSQLPQGFGATIRYDFDADKGQKITLCRFSPDGKKMFIGTGEILLGGGYDGYNCSQLVYYKVKDQADTFKKQCQAGNHVSMVYGDYVEDLIALAESLGVEPLVAD